MRGRSRRQEEPPDARLGAWLPAPGTVVTVGGQKWSRTWTSRVEHREGNVLIVVAPTRPRGEPIEAELGTPILLGWATDQGYLEADAVLTGTAMDVVLTWQVDASRVRRQQRRRAFRLPVALPLKVVPEEAGAGHAPASDAPASDASASDAPVQGQTLDVSEVGVRCLLPRVEAPEVGARVEISVAIRDEPPLLTTVDVVWRRRHDAEFEEFGLDFVDDDAERGERLRRFVFAEQFERRSGAARTPGVRGEEREGR